ncbi:MAG TPA: STN domain-containing protein [Tepidisphaeraceae bacterium]
MSTVLRYSTGSLAALLLVLCGVLLGLSCWPAEPYNRRDLSWTEPLSFSLFPFGSAPAPASGLPGRNDPIHFAQPFPAIHLNSIPLSDGLDYLRDWSGATIDVNWTALAAEGIRRDSQVSRSFGGQTFPVALARMLDGQNLAFTVDDNTIYVSTRREIGRVQRVRRARPQWPTHVRIHNKQAGLDEATGTSPPQWHRLDEVLDRIARRNPLDVDWESLKQVGVRPETPIDVERWPSDLLGSALRQASLDHDLQYEVRDGRLLVSTREWFDRDERPRKLLLVACALGIAMMVLVPFVLFRRRPVLRSAAFVSFVILSSAAAFGLTRATRASVLEATFAGKHWIVEALPDYPRGTRLWIRIEPGDWDAAALNSGPLVPPRETSVTRAQISIYRSGSPFQQLSIMAPCQTVVGGLGAGPVLWAIALITWHGLRFRGQRTRRMRGQCVECGYDLRASGDHCPECGRAV